MSVHLFPNNKTDWLADCIMSDGKNPKPLPVVANALRALRNDPMVRDSFGYDEMLRAVVLLHEIGQPLMGNLAEQRPVTDEDVTNLQEWMQNAGLKRIAHQVVEDAVKLHADESFSFHPVRNYLNNLRTF